MKKILVTGGAGYIGSILVPQLLKEGHKVAVVDNFMYKQSSLLDVCNEKKLKIIRGDVRKEEIIKENIKGVDFIIPLAAIVGMPACKDNPSLAKETNLEAIKLILKLRKPEQGIIFPNTNSGYGIGKKDKFCDESSPLNPISFYGKTKVEAEKAILDAGNAITLRLATVFGASPRMRYDLLVNDFVYRALAEKSIVLFESHFGRNYIHIRDVSRAFIHALNNFENMKNEPYNAGLSNANLNKEELCKEIQKYIPNFVFLKSEISQDIDKRDYIVSNEKIEKTGFKPKYSLENGIQELMKTYQVLRKDRYTNL